MRFLLYYYLLTCRKVLPQAVIPQGNLSKGSLVQIARFIERGRLHASVGGGTIRSGLTDWFECTPQIGSRGKAMGAIKLFIKNFQTNRFLIGIRR